VEELALEGRAPEQRAVGCQSFHCPVVELVREQALALALALALAVLAPEVRESPAAGCNLFERRHCQRACKSCLLAKPN
jgi:hypothetical protein